MSDLFQAGGLLEALLARGIQFRRSPSNPAEISLCCPFCSENRFRLGVNIQKDLGHCFNCDWRSRRATEDLAEAMDLGVLLAEEDVPDRGESKDDPKSSRPALPDDFVLMSDAPHGALYRKASEYLARRMVKDWQIKEKKIGVSLTGRYAYRIVFPVYYGKVLQGIVTRDFTDQQEPRYLNSRGMKAVYNSPAHKKNKAVICEGIFDCLAVERVVSLMNYDVLALLGHALTEKQEARLSDYRDIFLWPDPDVPGIEGFIGIAKQLRLRHSVFVVPPGRMTKDAGAMTPSEIAYQWAGRAPFSESLELKLKAEVALRDE